MHTFGEKKYMSLSKETARHLREMYFGNSFTGADLKSKLEGIDVKMANTKLHSFNTILALVYHVNYYVRIIIEVLKGGPLVGSDKLSFNHPDIQTQEEWESFQEQTWEEAETLAKLIETMDDVMLSQNFDNGKYGTTYRNLVGGMMHTNYHIGQISLLRKLLLEKESA